MNQRSFPDQLGNNIILPAPPQRIISLVPSQTELLYHLGLDNEVVGITKFCIHPKHWRNEKKVVGGTKNFSTDIIDRLQPDIIIGNKEENERSLIEQLRQKYQVWLSDIDTLDQAKEMIETVGAMLNRYAEAERLLCEIETAFKGIIAKTPKRVLYLIWRDPWMAAGSGTFVNTMLREIGLINSLDHLPRYPQLSDEDLRALDPEIIFLSTEPYPFKEKHTPELKALVPGAEILLVDGEMFSWYGSRLRHAPAYFNTLIV